MTQTPAEAACITSEVHTCQADSHCGGWLADIGADRPRLGRHTICMLVGHMGGRHADTNGWISVGPVYWPRT
jgi:hypothetical protein